MDQIVQYTIMSAILVSIGAGMFIFAGEDIMGNVESQHDVIEKQKKQSAEQVKLIDVMNSPLKLDIMNVGLNPIIIDYVFVDENPSSFTMRDMHGATVTQLEKGEIITITPSVSGTEIQIITSNNKIFTFE